MRQLRQALRFVLVGTAGTLAYAGLYVALARVLPAPVALVTAWLASTLATNLAHRRVTFGVRGAGGRATDAAVFLATSLVGLAPAQLVLAWRERSTAGELGVIVAATAGARVLRFAVMRWWVGARSGSARRAGRMSRVATERNDRVPEHHRVPRRIERGAEAGHDDHRPRPVR